MAQIINLELTKVQKGDVVEGVQTHNLSWLKPLLHLVLHLVLLLLPI